MQRGGPGRLFFLLKGCKRWGILGVCSGAVVDGKQKK